jgi:uncharacterized protein
LGPGDEALLETFLAAHAESSMFLRSNARAAGLTYRGAPLEAEYVADIDGGAVTAVAAHCWNGMLLVQAPSGSAAVARAAVRRSTRPVAGVSGPLHQVLATCAALDLPVAWAHKQGHEGLFALDLAALVVPPPLADGGVVCRRPRTAELGLLAEWRVAFSVEALHRSDGLALRAEAASDIRLTHERGVDWVLTAGGRPVAFAAFNAALPDIVQIGGVWVPRDLRNHGYSRAVVAGSLLTARAAGVTRAVLFAEDAAAIRSYQAIGFRRIGEYGLMLFPEPLTVR